MFKYIYIYIYKVKLKKKKKKNYIEGIIILYYGRTINICPPSHVIFDDGVLLIQFMMGHTTYVREGAQIYYIPRAINNYN